MGAGLAVRLYCELVLGKLYHLRNRLERRAPMKRAAVSALRAGTESTLAAPSRGATRPMMPKLQRGTLLWAIFDAGVVGTFCHSLLQRATDVIMVLSFPFRNAIQANSLVSDISV